MLFWGFMVAAAGMIKEEGDCCAGNRELAASYDRRSEVKKDKIIKSCILKIIY